MATLYELLNINGVVAAGEFTADGKLVDYKAKMDMSPEMAAMTAQFCATVTMMFNTLTGAFTQLSKMNWVPQQGWRTQVATGQWRLAVTNVCSWKRPRPTSTNCSKCSSASDNAR